MKSRIMSIRFPSGRRRNFVESRYDLIRRIASLRVGDWAKLEPGEEDAAQSLIGWGMIERHEVTPSHVRWSFLHERPIVGQRRDCLLVHKKMVHHLSDAQRKILIYVLQAERNGTAQLQQVIGDKKTQRMVRSLESRGVLAVQRNKGYWELTISPTWGVNPT
jgi:hypothetical protein